MTGCMVNFAFFIRHSGQYSRPVFGTEELLFCDLVSFVKTVHSCTLRSLEIWSNMAARHFHRVRFIIWDFCFTSLPLLSSSPPPCASLLFCGFKSFLWRHWQQLASRDGCLRYVGTAVSLVDSYREKIICHLCLLFRRSVLESHSQQILRVHKCRQTIFLSWRIKDQLDVTCYFISLLMCSTYFGKLIYPSSGACDYSVELPHWSYCSWFDVCWSFGVVGLEWYPCWKFNRIVASSWWWIY